YYRQDENAPNAIVSYYAKGSLVALALDLQLREASKGRRSLDDVMRALWQRHGQTGVGVEEEGIFELVAEIAAEAGSGDGKKLAQWLRRAVEGTDDLPLARWLKAFAVDYRAEPESDAPSLGVKLASGSEVKLASVFDG
ncbi:peptidase M61, partial [Azoarcus taiwanensis]|nr:peptidase M61 [Azoarcus taiwanensis]